LAACLLPELDFSLDFSLSVVGIKHGARKRRSRLLADGIRRWASVGFMLLRRTVKRMINKEGIYISGSALADPSLASLPTVV
jgi:hypothetical protein